MLSDDTYQHAMLMSGGSTRFGYYLGCYAAAVVSGNRPDLIFASCGGSIAAGIIAASADIEAQKALLLSEDMYRMYTRISVNETQSLGRILGDVCRRYLHSKTVSVYPDFHKNALFSVSHDEHSEPLFPFDGHYNAGPDVAIIGAKLCYDNKKIGQERQDNPIFEEVVFSTQRVAQLLKAAPVPKHGGTDKRMIKPLVTTETECELKQAIRISISDIFYLPPWHWNGAEYMGGMIDLTPIELAERCAGRLSLELKQPYCRYTAVPAFKKLLGFDPNERLRQVHDSKADVWIDTSDSPDYLKQDQAIKTIDWLSGKLKLTYPVSHAHYQQMMLKQWEYGFQRSIAAFSNSDQLGRYRLRKVSKLNTTKAFRQQLQDYRR